MRRSRILSGNFFDMDVMHGCITAGWKEIEHFADAEVIRADNSSVFYGLQRGAAFYTAVPLLGTVQAHISVHLLKCMLHS